MIAVHALLAQADGETQAQATGFPALLIIAGIVGLLVALGMVIGGRRAGAKRVALFCAGAVTLGVLLANLD